MQETDAQPTGASPGARPAAPAARGAVSLLGLGASLIAAIASLTFLVTLVRAIMTGYGGPGLLVMAPVPVVLAVISIGTGWASINGLRRWRLGGKGD